MTDLFTVNMHPQFGRNALATPDVLVAANKQLPTGNLKMSLAGNVTTYTAQGSDVPVGTALGEEWATGDLKGPIDYNEVPAYLDIFLEEQTATALGTTGAYLYEAEPSPTSEADVRSWTVEWGDAEKASVNYRSGYVRLTDLTFKGTRKTAEVDGKLLALAVEKNITMTAGATTLTAKRALGKTFSVFLATTRAGLNYASKLTRNFSWEAGIGDRYKPFWPVNEDLPSFGGLARSMQKVPVKLSVGAGGAASTGDQLLDSLRAGDRLYARIRSRGPQIAAIATPTTAPTLTAAAGPTSLAAGTYSVAYAYRTPSGTTMVSSVATVVLTSTQKINVTALGSLPDGVTSVDWYVSPAANNAAVKWYINNNGAAFSITDYGTGNTVPTANDAAIRYLFQIDAAVEVSAVPKESDPDGVFSSDVEFTMVKDDGWYVKYTIVNRQATVVS